MTQNPSQLCNGLLLICCVLFCFACGERGGLEAVAYRVSFNTQLQESCGKSNARYTKTIIDLNETPSLTQDSIMALIPNTAASGNGEDETSVDCILIPDLEYAFQYYFEQPRLKENYISQQKGDTLIAIVHPEKKASVKLQFQKILHTQDQKYFKFVHSRIQKDSWLYKHYIDIQVQFDEQGRYLSHELEIRNEVPLINDVFHAQILGKLDYP